ncbi:hypothetical protein SANTM175S_03552 [Streptomyces antimycoticus]
MGVLRVGAVAERRRQPVAAAGEVSIAMTVSTVVVMRSR